MLILLPLPFSPTGSASTTAASTTWSGMRASALRDSASHEPSTSDSPMDQVTEIVSCAAGNRKSGLLDGVLCFDRSPLLPNVGAIEQFGLQRTLPANGSLLRAARQRPFRHLFRTRLRTSTRRVSSRGYGVVWQPR